jgi:hypothetical protein
MSRDVGLGVGLMRNAMKIVHRQDRQAEVFYIHPWEVDPGQPRFSASRRSRFRQHTGLSKTKTNLKRLLGNCMFAPVAEAFSVELRATSVTRYIPLLPVALQRSYHGIEAAVTRSQKE